MENTMKNFANLSEPELRFVLSCMWFNDDLADVYSEALATRNTAVAVAAQEELMRRGDIDDVTLRFNNATNIGEDKEFSEAIVESFIKMGPENFPGIFTNLRPRTSMSMEKLLEGVDIPSMERKVDEGLLRRLGKNITLKAPRANPQV